MKRLIWPLIGCALLLSAWSNGGSRGGANVVSSPAPVITAGPSASPGTTTATITWTTDIASTSVVNYGLTSSYGSNASGSSGVTSHSVGLSSLTTSTTYHYQACSTAAGPTTCSSDLTFATGGGTASCPYVDTAGSDGCSSSSVGAGLAGASIQHANFFQGYANQEGQTYYEASFTGSISGGVLTVSGCATTCLKNPTIFETIQCTNGSGTQGACSTSGTLPAGVRITSLGTGTGGNGTYNLANASGVSAQGTMQGLRRPYWNVAGVEYAVGVAAGVTLKDPATMGVCPTPNTGDHICIDTFRTGSNNFNVAYVSGANPTVQGWDFTLEGGWMLLFPYNADLNGSVPGDLGAGFVPPTGAVTIKNNKFAPGTTFQVGGEIGTLCAASVGSSQSCGIFSELPEEGALAPPACASNCITGYLFTQNYIDGGAGEGANAGTSTALVGQICGSTGISNQLGNVLGSAGSNPTFTFNAILNWNNRCNLGWSLTANNNYWEGTNYNSTAHGEFTSISTGHTNQSIVVALAEINYNTILQPATYCGGATTFIWLTNGGASQSYADVETNNNSIVGNGCAMSVTANSSPGSTACHGTSADGSGCKITINTPSAWNVISNLGNTPLNLSGNFSNTTNASISQVYLANATWTAANNYLTVYGYVAASGDIIFNVTPNSGGTIVLNGTTWTFVTGTPTGNQLKITAGDSSQTITNAVTTLNASGDVNTAKMAYSFAGNSATGTITFTTNPANGSTVVLNGTTWTFVTGGATGNQVNIGANLAATLTAAATAYNASADTNTAKMSYTASSTVLTLTSKLSGSIGQGYTLSTTVSGATASGANLTGGQAVLYETAVTKGAAGNSLTIASTVTSSTLSGSTLTGGIDLAPGSDIEAGDQIQLAAGFGTTVNGKQSDTPPPAQPFPHGNAIVIGGTGCPGATACTGTGGIGTYFVSGMSGATDSTANTQIFAFQGGTGPAQNGVYRWACLSGSGCSMSIPAAPTTVYIPTLFGGSTPISGGPSAGGTITLWNCNNNYYDPLANGNPNITYVNLCGNNVTPATYNHTGNINLLNGAGL